MARWWGRDDQAGKGGRAARKQAELERRLAEIQATLRSAWPDAVTPEDHVMIANAVQGIHRTLDPKTIGWLDRHEAYSDILFGGPLAALPPMGRNAANRRQHQREVGRTPGSPLAPWPEDLFVLRARDGLVYGTALLGDPKVRELIAYVKIAERPEDVIIAPDAHEQLRATLPGQSGAGTQVGALMVVLDQPPADDEATPNALLDALMALAVHAPNPALIFRLPPELREYAEQCTAARIKWSEDNPDRALREVTLQTTGSSSETPRRTAAQIVPPGTLGTEWKPSGGGSGPGVS